MSTQEQLKGRAVLEAALAQGRRSLSEHEAKQLLQAYGIPVTREKLVSEISQLEPALETIGFPVVLKIDSPDILHKTEAGLVTLGCRDLGEAEAEFARIMRQARERHPQALLHGVLVQEMITGAVAECIVGAKKDPQFGPTLLFGLGGIFVEVFEDVALRLAPLTEADAASMIRETKGFKILSGARGRTRADIASIEDVLLKLSKLVLEHEPLLAEIDVNPLMVAQEGEGAKAADALVVLDREGITPIGPGGWSK